MAPGCKEHPLAVAMGVCLVCNNVGVMAHKYQDPGFTEEHDIVMSSSVLFTSLGGGFNVVAQHYGLIGWYNTGDNRQHSERVKASRHIMHHKD